MANALGILPFAIAVLISGCSADTAKRTAYETLQNVRDRECMRNPSVSCEKRETYEDYERKRKELDSPKQDAGAPLR